MPRTIVLAYSGGLDTSIIVPWLREHYDARVICVAADIGQGSDELRGVREKALASGAEECYIEDLREEFVRDFIFPTLRAGAVYNRKYLLGTAMARPLIAKRQVEVARRVGADALAHGCTGKGNDQVRFEMTFATLAPDLPVIAPWREWDIRSREDAIDYATSRGIPITATKEKIYSRDANLWHLSHEGGNLEDPNSAPKADMFMLTTEPSLAAGCTRVGAMSDDNIKDLRRKIVRAGGNTAVISFNTMEMSMLLAEVFRCSATPNGPSIPQPPAGAPPPPPPAR